MMVYVRERQRRQNESVAVLWLMLQMTTSLWYHHPKAWKWWVCCHEIVNNSSETQAEVAVVEEEIDEWNAKVVVVVVVDRWFARLSVVWRQRCHLMTSKIRGSFWVWHTTSSRGYERTKSSANCTGISHGANDDGVALRPYRSYLRTNLALWYWWGWR